MFLTVVVDRDLNVALQLMLVINMQPTAASRSTDLCRVLLPAGKISCLYHVKIRPRELMFQEHHVNMNSDIEISKSQW